MSQERCLQRSHSVPGCPVQVALSIRTRHHLGRWNPRPTAKLIARVGEGDSGAFELLYQRYARPVFALALRRLVTAAEPRTPSRRHSPRSGARPRATSSDRGPGAPWLYARRAERDRRPAARAPARCPAEPVDEPSNDAGPDGASRAAGSAWRVAPRARRAARSRSEADRARVLGRGSPRARSPSSSTYRSAPSKTRTTECALPARRCTGRRAVVS